MKTMENLTYLFKNYLKSKGNVRSYKNLKLALEADVIFEQSKKMFVDDNGNFIDRGPR